MRSNQPHNGQNRYDWVDIAKGLCIIAVVALWVHRSMETHAGWLGYFVVFAKPFRMPDFFVISGLFLQRVIGRPWKHYLDTKLVHYLYFLMLWTFIIIPSQWAIQGDWPGSLQAGLEELLYGLYKPVAMLWFLMMLSVYFIVTKLLINLHWWAVVAVAIPLHFFPMHTGIPPVDWFGEYYIFAYAGYRFSGFFFTMTEWVGNHRKQAWLMLPLWLVGHGILIKLHAQEDSFVMLLMGTVGIAALMSFSKLLSPWPVARVLSYMGKHSIAIYLGFYLVMLGVLKTLSLPWAAELNIHVKATVAWVCSFGGALLLYWLLQPTPLRFLYRRPAWAHLAWQRNGSLVSHLAHAARVDSVRRN